MPKGTADELRLLCDILIYWLKMHVQRVSREVLLPGKIKSLPLTDRLGIRVSVNEQALRHRSQQLIFKRKKKPHLYLYHKKDKYMINKSTGYEFKRLDRWWYYSTNTEPFLLQTKLVQLTFNFVSTFTKGWITHEMEINVFKRKIDATLINILNSCQRGWHTRTHQRRQWQTD